MKQRIIIATLLFCSYAGAQSSVNGVPSQTVEIGDFGPFMGTAMIQGLKPYFVGDLTTNGLGTLQSAYTVPTGYTAWTDVWCNNTSGGSVTWYEEITAPNGDTVSGGNPHIQATTTTAHDNTTGSMPAGTVYGLNSNASGLNCWFTTLLAPSATLPSFPVIYTRFFQGDNVIYQCCTNGTLATSVSGTAYGPLVGKEPQIFVTTLDSSSINFKLKIKRSGGSAVAADLTVPCAFSLTTPSGGCDLSTGFNTILQSGDQLIVNSGAGGSASGLSASESSSTVTVTSTLNPGVGSSVAMSGCTPSGYNSPVTNGVTQAFIVTASSGSSFQYTDTNTGLGSGSGCLAIWGPAGQAVFVQINEH